MRDLNGAYIPADGSYGLRLEITGNRFLLLWRNYPVLDTTFTVSEKDSGTFLVLEENGLNDWIPREEPYARLTECLCTENGFRLTEDFPISGESVTEMARTEDSRYGHFTVENDTVLPMLQGVWKSTEGFSMKLEFRGGTCSVNGESTEIVVLRPIGSTENRWTVADKDPSRDYVVSLHKFDFDGETITAFIPVCDAPQITLKFRKAGR